MPPVPETGTSQGKSDVVRMVLPDGSVEARSITQELIPSWILRGDDPNADKHDGGHTQTPQCESCDCRISLDSGSHDTMMRRCNDGYESRSPDSQTDVPDLRIRTRPRSKSLQLDPGDLCHIVSRHSSVESVDIHGPRTPPTCTPPIAGALGYQREVNSDITTKKGGIPWREESRVKRGVKTLDRGFVIKPQSNNRKIISTAKSLQRQKTELDSVHVTTETDIPKLTSILKNIKGKRASSDVREGAENFRCDVKVTFDDDPILIPTSSRTRRRASIATENSLLKSVRSMTSPSPRVCDAYAEVDDVTERVSLLRPGNLPSRRRNSLPPLSGDDDEALCAGARDLQSFSSVFNFPRVSIPEADSADVTVKCDVVHSFTPRKNLVSNNVLSSRYKDIKNRLSHH
ncbi:hypothetical protein LSH36_154g12017 [Paralvinella palmiformis]|uniref:Uncharacterized protein n=1 Tax=Paralvinella palmiformis TaxID=53620 RepID=A0AAD9JVF3_9ANNE|nr:hypothetical protein LSH36_154g12017 [Paralvinella palmiformis]